MTAIDKALAILENTHDGDDLSPQHLRLVETAVNGWLNEAGEVAFDALYAQVAAGTYARPWLHGVEGLTIDHQGYVYWLCADGREAEVEHFSYWDDESRARLAEYSVRLAAACRAVEAAGERVTCAAVLDVACPRREPREEGVRT